MIIIPSSEFEGSKMYVKPKNYTCTSAEILELIIMIIVSSNLRTSNL
jgi:hypothetical protein